jgi:hypothetical protein
MYDLTLVKTSLETKVNSSKLDVSVNGGTAAATVTPNLFSSVISKQQINVDLTAPQIATTLETRPMLLSMLPQTLSVNIAKMGAQGAAGISAYQSAVLAGYSGTELEFISGLTSIVEEGAFRYVGAWDANSGVYPVSPVKGQYYKVRMPGTVQGVHYASNDAILFNGSVWDKFDNTEASNTGLDYVGEFSVLPDYSTLLDLWRLNVIVKNTADANYYILRGTPLAWELFSLDGLLYQTVIESSQGTIFRVGQDKYTLLIARLFRNGVDITESTPAAWFRWRRVSGYPLGAPYDDATWNSSYNTGFKTISIGIDAIHARATFFCDIIST